MKNRLLYYKGMICAALVFVLLLGVVPVSANAKIYKGDEQKSYTLTGTIKKHNVSYDEIHTFTSYDLVLNTKIKIKSEFWGGTSKEKRIQINMNGLSETDQKKLKKLVGKKVRITGELIPGMTAWYCENYAIMAKSFKKK